MNDLDLVALLCSRLCHDLISPIGAVNNGVEVLLEGGGEDTQAQALELVTYSAGEAVRRVQFFRLAFGASGGSGAGVSLDDARKAAEGLLSTGRIALDWPDTHVHPATPINKTAMKILLNLILVAVDALARGGTAAVRLHPAPGGVEITVSAVGDRASLTEQFRSALAGNLADEDIDPRSAQPLYGARLAASIGSKILCSAGGDGRVELCALVPAA